MHRAAFLKLSTTLKYQNNEKGYKQPEATMAFKSLMPNPPPERKSKLPEATMVSRGPDRHTHFPDFSPPPNRPAGESLILKPSCFCPRLSCCPFSRFQFDMIKIILHQIIPNSRTGIPAIKALPNRLSTISASPDFINPRTLAGNEANGPDFTRISCPSTIP